MYIAVKEKFFKKRLLFKSLNNKRFFVMKFIEWGMLFVSNIFKNLYIKGWGK